MPANKIASDRKNLQMPLQSHANMNKKWRFGERKIAVDDNNFMNVIK